MANRKKDYKKERVMISVDRRILDQIIQLDIDYCLSKEVNKLLRIQLEKYQRDENNA